MGLFFLCRLCYSRGFANGVIAGKVEDLNELITSKYPPPVYPDAGAVHKVEVQSRGCHGPG